ncbi:MAG: hypothetical protein V2A79_14065 [Planctomycetota bacterium]
MPVRSRWASFLLYFWVALVAVGTFAGTLGYPFVYDDRPVIEQNPMITAPGGWLRVLLAPHWPPEQSLDPLYRPLTMLTLKLNYSLGGGGPAGFRAVNLALHALAAALVAALARRLWRRNSAAWVAGTLFAVHPSHADALGLIVGRSELLAGVFVTALLVRHLGLEKKVSDPFLGVRYHLTTALLFLLALGSKEHAMIAWPALAMIDLWHRQRSPTPEPWRPFLHRVVASHHLGLIFALAVFLFGRWIVFGGRTTLPEDLVDPFANPLIGQPTTVRLATPFALLWLMVRQWFAAAPLCPIWSVGGFALPGTWVRSDVLAGAATTAVLLAACGKSGQERCGTGILPVKTQAGSLCHNFSNGLLGLLVAGWRRRWRVGLPVGWLALGVLLPCHFIPAANWLYAERWTYLPGVFLAVLVAGLAQLVPRVSVVGSTLAAALLGTTTLHYQRCWATHERLFEAVVERQPYSYHGLLGLAAVRHRAGRLDECRIQVERFTERFPQSERAWFYRVLLTAELEDWDAAADALRHWGALWPAGPPPPEIVRIAEQVRAHGR